MDCKPWYSDDEQEGPRTAKVSIMSKSLLNLISQPRNEVWKICRPLPVVLLLLLIFPGFAAAQFGDFLPLQQKVKTLSTNLNGFGIPFKVADQSGQFIEVQLYYSTDKGETWSFHSRQPISEREFPFTADGDGEYWFAIKTLDRNRRLLPDGDARPELKIIVDSVKPRLDFRIEADAAGRVVCRWNVTDEDLNSKSLKIGYRSVAGDELEDNAADSDWKTVPAQLKRSISGATWSDQLAWWPDTMDQKLEVKLEVADHAGNSVIEKRFVSVRPTLWRRSSSGSTLQNTSSPFASDSPNPVIEVNQKETSAWQPKLRPIISNLPELADQKGAAQPPSSAPVTNVNRWRLNDSMSQQPATPPVVIASRSAALPPGVEIASPPMPLDFVQTNLKPTFREMASGSVTWESDVQSHESTERSFVGTTMGPAPDLAPQSSTLGPRSTDSISANPSTRVRNGKNIITESTTSWPNNQWSGPPVAKVQPKSELTPNTRRMVAINGERTAPAPVDRSNEFKNVGFRKPPKSIQNGGGSGRAFPGESRSSILDQGSELMPESANTQIISTKRFRLNYDIDAIDPSGVGRVDLWMTQDRGQTWKIWGQDPDNVSPFPVEVTEEGIFGFRIVVRSKDGLAGRGPMQGEEADMWIQVDVTAPLVRINSVPYGRGRDVGQLVINYAVSDSNLSLRPNTLQWSNNPDGPWTTIEKDLRNDGRYVWKPEQNVPHRIFLRLEALDRAGNAGVHLLEQAIDISGLVPRGTIFGVDPVGE